MEEEWRFTFCLERLMTVVITGNACSQVAASGGLIRTPKLSRPAN
jgi:hypothetical protein